MKQKTTNQLLTPLRISIILAIALLYFVSSALLINYRLILSVLSDPYPLTFKIQMTNSLLFGTLLSMPLPQILLQIAIALLVGINIVVLAVIIRRLKHQKDLKLTTGGSTLIALMSAGCAHCGVSLLSILGISSAFLPLRGAFLQYMSLGLLTFSLAYSLRRFQLESCKIR